MHALSQQNHSLRRIVWGASAFLVVILLVRPSHPGQAQEASAEYFPETGHYLSEPFLSFFETNGGLPIWGPPITDAIEENGHPVQYFQRARMECLAEASTPCEVHLSPLGELLGYRTPRQAPAPSSLIDGGLCQYFPDTGHNVCFSFLTFYLDRGGPDRFGQPISELTVEPGMVAQYFQRARIEWHLGASAGEFLQIAAIGEEYYHARGLEPDSLLAAESPPTPQATSTGVAIGDYVRIMETAGAGLRFRSGAGLSYEEIQLLDEGTVLRVVGGPEIADGFTWWYLDHDGSLGWCANDWLERVEAPNSP